MKKQYIMPQIVVATIQSTTLLAGSGDALATPVDQRPSSDVSGSTPSAPTDNQFSKQHSFDLWDDEE